MRKAIRIALDLPKGELSSIRKHLYELPKGQASPESNWSSSARELAAALSSFLKPNIPVYWRQIARTYYDHYIFQINGHPVPTFPERHAAWARQEAAIAQRCRLWLRFNRDLFQMTWRRRTASGIVP
jgi:hypothetical protein